MLLDTQDSNSFHRSLAYLTELNIECVNPFILSFCFITLLPCLEELKETERLELKDVPVVFQSCLWLNATLIVALEGSPYLAIQASHDLIFNFQERSPALSLPPFLPVCLLK